MLSKSKLHLHYNLQVMAINFIDKTLSFTFFFWCLFVHTKYFVKVWCSEQLLAGLEQTRHLEMRKTDQVNWFQDQCLQSDEEAEYGAFYDALWEGQRVIPCLMMLFAKDVKVVTTHVKLLQCRFWLFLNKIMTKFTFTCKSFDLTIFWLRKVNKALNQWKYPLHNQ